MCNTSYVQSSTGFFASIEYSTKGWIYGDYHQFKATISHRTALKGNTVIEGQWTGKSTIKRPNQKAELFLDLKSMPKSPVHVKPVSEQGELESRKVWETTSAALKGGDYALASTEKSAVENKQRTLLREREENGNEKWKPVYFTETTSNDLFGEMRDFIIINSNNKFVNTFDEKAWFYSGTI